METIRGPQEELFKPWIEEAILRLESISTW
jgi:hypothetical protein